MASMARSLVFLLLAGRALAVDGSDKSLQTAAEESGFRATATHKEVVSFCGRLAKRSPRAVRIGTLGKSSEGRELPLVILADPPVRTAAQAKRSGKLVVFAMGNIHAGEVCGKEALLMLAREIATRKKSPLLKDLIIVLAPIFNADGNERFGEKNRPRQKGPAKGVGIRTNAQGLDLNRDYMKLESPETRALVRFFNEWDPAVIIDTHTTNGSYHRYSLTWDGPRHPATDPKLVKFVRDELLPEAGRRLEKATGYKSFFYGNFNKEHTRWQTYPALPRYGAHYIGLRNRIAILSEAYAYAPYKDRVLATRGFVKQCLRLCAERKARIRSLLSAADRGQTAARKDRVSLASKAVALPGTFTIPGFAEAERNGRRVKTEKKQDYKVNYFGVEQPIRWVTRPSAYLIPAKHATAIQTLRRHGIAIEVLRKESEFEVEAYRIDRVSRQARAFQKHRMVRVAVTPHKERRRFKAGTILVRTNQPLGALLVNLLEPHAPDGLCAWNFFDAGITKGSDFPVRRVMSPVPRPRR